MKIQLVVLNSIVTVKGKTVSAEKKTTHGILFTWRTYNKSLKLVCPLTVGMGYEI